VSPGPIRRPQPRRLRPVSRARASRRPLLAAVASAGLALLGVAGPRPARADAGMWPFDMVPIQRIAKDHGVTLTPQWLDHVRLASVRFNLGGSGSFVSPKGLVLTNHHVAHDCIAKIASPGHDYVAAGYLAGKDGPEIKCPDLEIDQLTSIEDVTQRVLAARQPGASDADANQAMKAQMASIEKDCHDQTGLRCDVVTLYAGATYSLYRSKRFTDVRLVFAPEGDMAFFGGDPENFTFPRFDLDMAIFRVYDGDQPLAPSDFLAWNAQGPKDGDVVFTSGNPGSTSRDDTVAELEVLRDVVYPRALARYGAWHKALLEWSATGPEAKRQARAGIFGVENGLKAITGFEGGLRDAALFRTKQGDEKALRAAVHASADLESQFGGAWDSIAAVEKALAAMYPRYEALEAGLGGTILRDARHLVRLPAQRALPNDKRLKEYRDTALEELRMHVEASAAIYPGVEEAYVREWLELLSAALGPKDPALAQVLAGRDVARAARDMVAGSRLFDTYARAQLWDGGQSAVDASTDPLIASMRALDPEALAVRKQYEDGVEAPMRELGRRVAKATFAVKGTTVAPDATFTPRLSVGVVKGYEDHGKKIPWATDFAGLYKHATGKAPLQLPASWIDARARLNPATPFNLVSTNDIVGGSSGSPLVGAAGDIVGLIFDSNIQGLPNRFIYQEATARSVSVDTAGMLEALRVIYGADALVAELAAH
jgi:hypothetical protein